MNDQEQLRPDIVSNRVYNDDMIKGRWLEVKGGVRKLWGELTDDELEETKGDMTSVAGLIQRKFGEGRESIQQKLDGIFREFHDREVEEDAGLDDSEENERNKLASESSIDAANRNLRERQI